MYLGHSPTLLDLHTAQPLRDLLMPFRAGGNMIAGDSKTVDGSQT